VPLLLCLLTLLPRILPSAIKFERKLAAGSEGEVWLGSLRNDKTGEEETVAIKKALSTVEDSTKPVFDEREVAVLMNLTQHERPKRQNPILPVLVPAGVVLIVRMVLQGG